MTLNDTYYGDDLTAQEYDRIALDRLTRKFTKEEARLQSECWFDYRFMHPVKRTYLFAAYYSAAFKREYEKRIDADSSLAKGYSRPDPLDNRPSRGKTRKLVTPTYFWQARRMADELRIPYDFYINTGMRFVLDSLRTAETAVGRGAGGNKGKLLISPGNLYQDRVVEHVAEKWDEHQRSFIRKAEDQFYVFTEAPHHPYRREHEAYLLRAASKLGSSEFAVQNYLDQGLIRLEAARLLHGNMSVSVSAPVS